MKTIPLVFITLALVACSPTKYLQDRFNPVASAKEECASMGYRVGTDAYANCVQNLYAQKQRVNAARAASQPNTTSTTCQPWLNGYRCTSN